jgi:pimeloyl-ACP methyl ester carboxylesterase
MEQCTTCRTLALSGRLLGAAILLTAMAPAPAQSTHPGAWVSVSETNTPGPDYSQPRYWMLASQNPAVHPVDVLFFHTSTYTDPNYIDPLTGSRRTTPVDSSAPPVWNQTIAEAIADKSAAPISNAQVSVFAACCNIYAPFYRQAAMPEVLQGDSVASERALSVAYADIEAAFDYYMAHLNNGRPFILAGHSQGSNLLLWLLERRMDHAAYRQKMVAAYVIGWSVTVSELDRYPHLEMCESAAQTGCIVSYNTQGPLAQFSMGRPGAVGVNPLLTHWTTSTDVPPASLNLGAVFLPPAVTARMEIPNFSGAFNQDGALILTTPPTSGPISNAIQLYHTYDYAMFYRNLEQNAQVRIDAFRSGGPRVRRPDAR